MATCSSVYVCTIEISCPNYPCPKKLCMKLTSMKFPNIFGLTYFDCVHVLNHTLLTQKILTVTQSSFLKIMRSRFQIFLLVLNSWWFLYGVQFWTQCKFINITITIHGTHHLFLYDSKGFRPMGLLPDTENCGLRMRRGCRERFPRHRLQREALVSDPSMHHGTCVAHVPWCMPRTLTLGGGESVPDACAILRNR